MSQGIIVHTSRHCGGLTLIAQYVLSYNAIKLSHFLIFIVKQVVQILHVWVERAYCLFAQPLVHAWIKENIKAPRHWPLWRESTGDRWIPPERSSNAENVFIWWRHHDVFSWKYQSSEIPSPFKTTCYPVSNIVKYSTTRVTVQWMMHGAPTERDGLCMYYYLTQNHWIEIKRLDLPLAYMHVGSNTITVWIWWIYE